MTLTVPTSRADPGRAARPDLSPAPDTAGAVAEFGQTMLRLGTGLENDRLDREFKRAQVDLTRDLNDLRLQVEQIGDPDQADAAWTRGVNDLRTAYLDEQADGTRRIDPRNADRFGLAYDDLANRHAFSLGARNLARRQSERVATFDRYAFEATRAAATSDPDTRAEMLANGDEQIAGLLAAGIVDAEGAEKMRQDLRTEMASAAAIEVLNADPADYLEREEAGEFDGLTPAARARTRKAAQDALVQQAELARKHAETSEMTARKELRTDLNRISSLSDTTRLGPQDLELLESPFVEDMALADEDVALALRRARARVSLDSNKTAYAAMTTAELQGEIEAERARTVAHPFQEERLALLEDLLETTQTALSTDPLGHMGTLGHAVPDLPLDQGETAFRAGLARRAAFGAGMVKLGYTDKPPLLRPDERRALKQSLAPEADPAERAGMIAGLVDELGPDQGPALVRQITGDRATHHAAFLIGAGAPPEAVDDLITGQRRIADGTATRPSRNAFREAFVDRTGGRFAQWPELQAQVMDAAEAIYAEAAPLAESTDIDTGVLEIAIDRALGGDGAETGGLAEIDPFGFRNKFVLPLPPGVSGQAVQDAMEALTAATGELTPAPPRGADGSFDMTAERQVDLSRLQRASLTGGVPDFGGKDPRTAFQEWRIVPWWADGRIQDQYILVRSTPAGDIAVRDTNGGAYKFSLKRLVGGRQ